MGKSSKTIIYIVIIILAALLIKNLFSKPEEPFNPKIYKTELKPISFPKKVFPEYDQDTSDPAVQYTHLWKISELYDQSSQSCLKTFSDQHPNVLVQKENLTSLYGIEIGSPRWFELTAAFENYASEVCYSFSGKEMEIVYSESIKNNLSQSEISELLKFFNTDLGKKHIYAGKKANDQLLKVISQKQRDASTNELKKYYNKIEELQKAK